MNPWRVADFVGNQAAWWCCILCVRMGHPALAVAGPAAYLGVHCALRRSVRVPILLLAGGASALGFVVDSALVRLGFLELPGTSTGWSAGFMVSLWAAFGVSMTSSMRFLQRRSAGLALLFGAVAGPVAYSGGERLGVLRLASHAGVAVGVAWALALVALTALARSALDAREAR